MLDLSFPFKISNKGQCLSPAYYNEGNTVGIAKSLLGKVLIHETPEGLCAGVIVETEAYLGESDKAAHVYNGRRTKRTETMYGPAGHAYIYLCYGIHSMLNVVTHREGIPQAVLIRALHPWKGIELMRQRRNKKKLDASLTRGPGSLCQAMGIHYSQDNTPLWSTHLKIEDWGLHIAENNILSGTRIGVAYAQEDALRPYRFWIKDNLFVSKAPRPYPLISKN